MGEYMKKFTVLVFILSLSFSIGVQAQMPVSPPNDDPKKAFVVDPFRIVGNIYFIGTSMQGASYLIKGSEGHIIFDTVYEESPLAIVKNIEKLGFNPKDVKLIVGTHAHSDHVGGHAMMQEMTGAEIAAAELDRNVIETGGNGSWPPAEVDRILSNGEVISLGDISVAVHMTPGHTPGTMTFTTVVEEDGKKFNVVLMGGVRMASLPLLGNPDYPNIATDLAETFRILKSLPVDIYLGAHGYWYNLYEKIQRMKAGEGFKVFLDAQGYRRAIDGWQQAYIYQLLKESSALINN
jgi:metallo-beta-lactamase class B